MQKKALTKLLACDKPLNLFTNIIVVVTDTIAILFQKVIFPFLKHELHIMTSREFGMQKGEINHLSV